MQHAVTLATEMKSLIEANARRNKSRPTRRADLHAVSAEEGAQLAIVLKELIQYLKSDPRLGNGGSTQSQVANVKQLDFQQDRRIWPVDRRRRPDDRLF